MTEPVWSEANSETFIDFGRYYVPERDHQIALMASLVPANATVVAELCCGEGLLAREVLDRLPAAKLIAFDGSAKMRAAAASRAGRHRDRLETREFDLAARSWRRFEPPLDAVLSSLAIHHLDGPAKAALYRDMFAALKPGGALVVADLIAPADARGATVAADTWDHLVRARARALDGNEAAFEHFVADQWNHFRTPDPLDQPSGLLEQLRWLAEAGFAGVDVYWCNAGHAVFGGRKPA